MNRDDIQKFRRICEILRTEKRYNNRRIGDELGLSEPTIKKLLGDDLAEIKIRASVLGHIQDFNRKHCEDLNYAGIECEKPKKEKKVTNDNVTMELAPETVESPSHVPEDLPGYDSAEDRKGKGQRVEFIDPSEPLKLFFKSLAEAIPKNMTMIITINGQS